MSREISDETMSYVRSCAIHHCTILNHGMPQEYVSLVSLGINRKALLGLSGYRLAARLREAADRLELVARWMEDCEAAYYGVPAVRVPPKTGGGAP